MVNQFLFPFGEKLQKVKQEERSPKKVFILGVYASAVHARWIDQYGRQKVAALAVQSEPYIFWRGENAEDIIGRIKIPKPLGQLILPANPNLNGPSGRALDNLYLSPLGLKRENSWLCDLLPYSRINANQRNAIKQHYTKEIIDQFHLQPATIPDFNKSELDSSLRRKQILEELELSKAEELILLGDLPIYYFLRFHDKKYTGLSSFGKTKDLYGRSHEITINNKTYLVRALCHPRQADRLGKTNIFWGNLHDSWIKTL
ncbi:MAG: hypothetical protein RRZ66_04110 [Bacteroidales bacterium]